jgi:hypothetical protein
VISDANHRLSKSRFVAGTQCHKLLWWRVHEPNAIELQPGAVLKDRFDQGNEVGEMATELFPGGLLIDLPHTDVEERLRVTAEALMSDAPAIFEATFVEDNTFVAIDILERGDDGFHLIEVKSSSRRKPEHITDVGVQLHVAQQAGVDIERVSVMHMNSDFRHPNEGELLCLTDVTAEAMDYVSGVGVQIRKQLDILAEPLPVKPIGSHCNQPRRCPFIDRCWPQDPTHISKLYNVGPVKAAKYMADGIHRISDLPADAKLPLAAQRQLRSMEENRIQVDPGLADVLADFDGVLGFLDFETTSRAIPMWPGLGPWGQAAAQFSYHEGQPDGTYTHVGWLAEGPEDARPDLARAMIEATARADHIVMYTSFERTRIRALQRSVPEVESELLQLEQKLLDLHPVVRDNIYHPEFHGSFSIKAVLQPMVPDLSYRDLVIVDGLVASVEIARLLFVADKIAPEERERVRKDLLDYCERDTWAMVKLLEALRLLATSN